MAIKKSNSKQLMDIMQQSEDKIKKLSSDVASMRLTLDKRLQVMKNMLHVRTHISCSIYLVFPKEKSGRLITEI